MTRLAPPTLARPGNTPGGAVSQATRQAPGIVHRRTYSRVARKIAEMPVPGRGQTVTHPATRSQPRKRTGPGLEQLVQLLMQHGQPPSGPQLPTL